MQAASTTSVLPWIFGASLLSLLGISIFLRGLYPRRVGSTPFCAKCNYNLTGINRDAEDARCPECGTHLDHGNWVVHGERRRRRGHIVAGAVLLTFAVAAFSLLAVRGARGINWYHWKPASYVIDDFTGNNSKLRWTALKEIRRRLQRGSLSMSHQRRLVGVCLAEQQTGAMILQFAPGGFPAGWCCMDLLGELYDAGAPTEAQLERLYANSQRFSLAARPRVVHGQSFRLELRHEWRAPSRMFWIGVEHGPLLLDGQPIHDSYRYPGYLSGMAGGTVDALESIDLTIDEAGHHTLSTEVSVGIYLGDRETLRDNPPVFEISIPVSTEIEVLATEPPDYVRLLTSPELDESVRACCSFEDVRIWERDGGGSGLVLSGAFVVQTPVPAHLALRIYARVDGTETELLDVVQRKSTMPGITGTRRIRFTQKLPTADPREIHFIVRSSKDEALETTDLEEIWGGELRFEDVQIEQPR